MEENTPIKKLLSVEFNAESNQYMIELGKGSNVAETAFAMVVVIKCLLRDEIIKSPSDILNLINKYLTEPQYDEIVEEDTKDGTN